MPNVDAVLVQAAALLVVSRPARFLNAPAEAEGFFLPGRCMAGSGNCYNTKYVVHLLPPSLFVRFLRVNFLLVAVARLNGRPTPARSAAGLVVLPTAFAVRCTHLCAPIEFGCAFVVFLCLLSLGGLAAAAFSGS